MGAFETLLVVGGLGALVVCLVQAGRAFWTVRQLSASGPTPMSELSPGLHEVRGTSLAEGGVTAPVSGRACMYWRVVVEQLERSRWETVVDRREGVPVWIDDGTGRVRVDPTAGEVVVSGASRTRVGVYTHPSAEWTDIAGRLGTLAMAPTQSFLRWREEFLDPGDVVTVVGTAGRDEGGGWEISGATRDGLVVSDRDDAEVIRHHRRLGWRWSAGAGLAALVLGALAYVNLSG